MSVCYTVDIFCDSEGYVEWIFGYVQRNETFQMQKVSREIAEQYGWIYKDGKDYCPEYAKKIGG